jgi:poly-gamma-glutamate capsule biosynthesis protein CapA/YwtB (metallophosphatase superfamily)
MRFVLTGDVMLGRLVNRYMVSNASLAPETVWGNVLPHFLTADCRCINLECVISSRGQPWRPMVKPFHFRANPRATDILQAARVNCATLANNHVLDYGPEALLDCLTFLDQANIQHTGAGLKMDAACAPACLDLPQGKIAVLALTDNEPEWAATSTRPGVNYVNYDSRGLLSPYRKRMTDIIRLARQQASFVIISAHIGPNWGTPSSAMRSLAHELLDLGGDLYWGHSNHTPQGIELYKDKVILYSTGDFIDDYAVDPDERNDLSFLFTLEVSMEKTRGKIARIEVDPVRIAKFQVHRAVGQDIRFLERTFRNKCRAFHTDVIFQDGRGSITVT